jgi:hypothetical protein
VSPAARRPQEEEVIDGTFILAHRAPQGYRGSPEAMARWNAWFERLGTHLVDAGNPVFERAPVGNCGPDTVLGGYTLVTAATRAEAVALAERCPLLADGGGVEVGEFAPGPKERAAAFTVRASA